MNAQQKYLVQSSLEKVSPIAETATAVPYVSYPTGTNRQAEPYLHLVGKDMENHSPCLF